VNLKHFDRIGWMTAETDLWPIAEYLTQISHTPLLLNGALRRFARVDDRLFAAGLVGRQS